MGIEREPHFSRDWYREVAHAIHHEGESLRAMARRHGIGRSLLRKRLVLLGLPTKKRRPKLTPRQAQVYKLAKSGLRPMQIAEKLGISKDCARYHLWLARQKMKVK